MVSRHLAKTRTAIGFGLVGLSGLAVNQLLFWLLTEVGTFWISWGAVLATQGSTVWNFILNDRFVYAEIGGRNGRYRRFAKSWTANTMSLIFRVPLLLVLAHSGMNPHWANITTLVALFGLRFWISDRFIWSSKRLVADVTGEAVVPPTPADVLIEMKREELGPHMALNLRPGRRTKRHYYDIHGIVSIASEVELPELVYFTVAPFTRHADVTVRRGYVGDRRMINRVTAIKGPGSFVYREHLGSMGVNFRVDLDDRIVVTVSPLLARSKHVVYTNVVEALNRFVLVNKGYMLLHSATVQLGDRTVMLSAQTDTGKTGTILRLLQEHPEGTAFLSDDMTIINSTVRAVNTRVLSLPQRALLAVQSRVHSKQGREFALLLARLNIPIIAINAVTQIVVPPPKYMIDKLVPTVTYGGHGTVDQIFIIGRGEELEEPLSHDEAMSTLLANTEDAYSFPPFAIMERAITLRKKDLHKGKKQDIVKLRMRERAILDGFLGTMPVTRLMSPDFGWADVIPERVGFVPDPVTGRPRMTAAALEGHGDDDLTSGQLPQASAS
jgi:dolichol-phosphate mannosyltransferase